MTDTIATPVIGLTARTLPLQAARQTRPTETVARSYIEPIERHGALPVVLPNAADPKLAEAYLDRLDGLLLTGGDDPHPHLFDEEPHPKIEVVDERRDKFEIALVRAAHARGLPVLGICRGVQLLNIALGGDIYQDIESQTPSEVGHAQRRMDDGPWHKIALKPGSRLARIMDTESISVNSFHHQACRRVAEGLEICATCEKDGLIEALEAPEMAFFLGVQWHPELGEDEMDPLFAVFVESARHSTALSSK